MEDFAVGIADKYTITVYYTCISCGYPLNYSVAKFCGGCGKPFVIPYPVKK